MVIARLVMEAEGGVSDSPDPSAFAILIAILVGGLLLLGLATWYSARRPPD